MTAAAPALGARPLGGGRCRFTVWAPSAERVEIHLVEPDRVEPLEPLEHPGGGLFAAELDGVEAGRRYRYRLDGGDELPDPASALQPDGVGGPSEVVEPGFAWTDAGWRGRPLEELVLYELHVGTFTPEGTFDAAAERLAELADLGVTAIELMPVAQFPGVRNWGYDGVFPYAVQHSYGGPGGLKRLVDACHRAGLAAYLDVVHNHLGPEGNVLERYGPVFTDRYRTPWGRAINMDGRGSDGVRGLLIGSALRFVEEFHLDGLRLDAVDQIADRSAVHFLAELAEAVHRLGERLGRRVHLIAESDLNDPRMVVPRAGGGLGVDAQWSGDLHHSLHVLLTGERGGYYADFDGTVSLAKAYRDAFVYDGDYSAYRGRRHGAPARGIHGRRFVVFAQTHDQVGNRMLGERLGAVAGLERAKLAAGAVLLAPFVPLLFMGEEYGESAPFLYFTDHAGAELAGAVRRGRAEEFASFGWAGEPPDPQSEDTFRRSTLRWERRSGGSGARLIELHRELLRLRRELAPLRDLDPRGVEVARADAPPVVWLRRRGGGGEALVCLHFGDADADLDVPFRDAGRRVLLDSADPRFGGPGGGGLDGGRLHVRPASFVLLDGGAGG